ncbi:hypothetical protein NSY32_11000 [Acinetobacter baumannii]|nr:hypothetical protein [Acinetobacter baumannii]
MPDDGPELEELVREFIFGEADETEEGFDSMAKKLKLEMEHLANGK